MAASLTALALAASFLGPTPYADPDRGVTAEVPAGWHARPRLTALAYPREVVTLASFPLPSGGNCAPDRARARMPADGALVFVVEYRPRRGRIWTDAIRRKAFPRRPARLELPRRQQRLECFGRGSILRFRDADRPLQVFIALGPKAPATRRAQVERVLDHLRFTPLPPPPPDP